LVKFSLDMILFVFQTCLQALREMMYKILIHICMNSFTKYVLRGIVLQGSFWVQSFAKIWKAPISSYFCKASNLQRKSNAKNTLQNYPTPYLGGHFAEGP
jgi:hypothetical protein